MLHPRNSDTGSKPSLENGRARICIKIIDVLDIEGSTHGLCCEIHTSVPLLNKCDELPANRGAQIENYDAYMRSIGMRNIVQCVAMSAEKRGR